MDGIVYHILPYLYMIKKITCVLVHMFMFIFIFMVLLVNNSKFFFSYTDVDTIFCLTSNLVANLSFKSRISGAYFDMILNILEFSSF